MRAECVRTIRHGAHHLALSKIFGQQNRVSGRVCHGRRVELVEAVDAAVDGLLFDERSHGIVDEDFRAIGNACLLEQIKRGAGAVHTLGATRNHGTHLGITGFVDEHVHHIADTLVDHDDDVAHAIVAFERLDAPADDWLIPHRNQLLGIGLIESRAETGRQHHGHNRHLLFLHLLSLTHTSHRKPPNRFAARFALRSARNPQ